MVAGRPKSSGGLASVVGLAFGAFFFVKLLGFDSITRRLASPRTDMHFAVASLPFVRCGELAGAADGIGRGDGCGMAGHLLGPCWGRSPRLRVRRWRAHQSAVMDGQAGVGAHFFDVVRGVVGLCALRQCLRQRDLVWKGMAASSCRWLQRRSLRPRLLMLQGRTGNTWVRGSMVLAAPLASSPARAPLATLPR